MVNQKIIIGILIIFLEILLFRFAIQWETLPIPIPAAITCLYALWSKDIKLSFIFGFWSLMAAFMGPILFYMKLPPISVSIQILGMCVIFGLFGVGVAFIGKREL